MSKGEQQTRHEVSTLGRKFRISVAQCTFDALSVSVHGRNQQTEWNPYTGLFLTFRTTFNATYHLACFFFSGKIKMRSSFADPDNKVEECTIQLSDGTVSIDGIGTCISEPSQ